MTDSAGLTGNAAALDGADDVNLADEKRVYYYFIIILDYNKEYFGRIRDEKTDFITAFMCRNAADASAADGFVCKRGDLRHLRDKSELEL